MIIDYIGVKEVRGSLIVIDGVSNVSFEEIVEIRLDDGTIRQGRVVQIEGDRIVVQVFEGTKNISLNNTRTRLKGHPMELALSSEILGRVFDGVGRPIDGLGDVFPEKKMNVNGMAINPVSRLYPKDYINTGVSTIDVLTTLIRGQKLPIFSGSGMKHNELAVQIARQAKISSDEKENFAIVFAAMGVKNDVAEYFSAGNEKISDVRARVLKALPPTKEQLIERFKTKAAVIYAQMVGKELNETLLACQVKELHPVGFGPQEWDLAIAWTEDELNIQVFQTLSEEITDESTVRDLLELFCKKYAESLEK